MACAQGQGLGKFQIDLTFIPPHKPDGRPPQVLLLICVVVSLALGLFQDFGTTRPDGDPPVDWVEGVAIIVAVLIVVSVGSLNDWQKEKRFEGLNEKESIFPSKSSAMAENK